MNSGCISLSLTHVISNAHLVALVFVHKSPLKVRARNGKQRLSGCLELLTANIECNYRLWRWSMLVSAITVL